MRKCKAYAIFLVVLLVVCILPVYAQGPGGGGTGGGTGGGSSSGSNGTSANTITSSTTVSGTSYTSTTADQNALRIDGATVTLNKITVKKSGDTTSQDNSNFYGDNAGLLVFDGATATIVGATVTTNASGGNAVFSYGSLYSGQA